MEYIEYMNNLRKAFKLIKNALPEIEKAAIHRILWKKDREVEILLKSDEEWEKLQEDYFEIEPKLYQFNPEEEYGLVHTMWPEDMRGE